jgi:small subunit ribosomal protein S1
MEIYNKLDTPASKEFEQLLNSQFTKTASPEEGKIINCTVTKVTDNYIYLSSPGLKQEPILDINELKSMGMLDKAKIDQKIPVLLERIEHPKTGEIVVSASKAAKIEGWSRLVEAYEKNEPIMGKITGRVKGGCIVEHIDTGSLMFLPGSQISDKPLKDISNLMNVPQKFALIKLDKVRGNACVSRREIISSFKKEDKIKILEKYNIGDVITGAEVKGYSSFGCFFSVNGELDVLCHLQEISYSRINHPEEFFTIGDLHSVKVISKDLDKLQIGVSLKQMGPDPFNEIDKYKKDSDYKVKIAKVMDFGAFAELQPGLSTLLHNSELSYTNKNATAKKMLKVGQEILCRITEIDKEKRRVAISYRLTKENPFITFEKTYGVDSEITGEVVSKNEYALFLKVDEIDCQIFVHANDLTYQMNGEEELAKYKIGDKLKVKVLEIKIDEQKIRASARALMPDPFMVFFKDKKLNDTITVKIISSDNKGLIVRPEKNCEMDFTIKKSQIAINAADARPARFTGGERIDVAIAELNLSQRKASLSIKLLEEIQNKDAISKFSSPLSGKNLPFSSLSDELEKKDKKKKEE